MKKRVISAIVAFAIFIPIFLLGGIYFNIAFYVLTIMGLNEFMKARGMVKTYPDFIRLISYLMITILYFGNVLNPTLEFTIDFRVISGLILIMTMPVVLYHDEKTYSIKDAFYLLGGIFFLGYSMSMFYLYRSIDLKLIIFLFLITIITDTYAYLTGRLIGKNKLLEDISPNKTWEGTIGGSLASTFVGTVYYVTLINPSANILNTAIVVLFLSVIGQFGDLFFSAIKRQYKIKDFSNIMPGHGGILDRLDSIIFVMLAYTFFLTII